MSPPRAVARAPHAPSVRGSRAPAAAEAVAAASPPSRRRSGRTSARRLRPATSPDSALKCGSCDVAGTRAVASSNATRTRKRWCVLLVEWGERVDTRRDVRTPRQVEAQCGVCSAIAQQHGPHIAYSSMSDPTKQHPEGLRLFLDLDGVLADFDRAAHAILGAPPDAVEPNVMWRRIAGAPDFFGTLPLMPDALELWRFAAPYSPTILTGSPRRVRTATNALPGWRGAVDAARTSLPAPVPTRASLMRRSSRAQRRLGGAPEATLGEAASRTRRPRHRLPSEGQGTIRWRERGPR